MMKKNLFVLLCCLGAVSATTAHAAAADGTPPANTALSAIPSLDIPRYMGTWYEIARFPNWFQRKCTGDSKADYSLRKDGMVEVINRCRTEGGAVMEAVGAARQIGPASSAKLEVRFAPAWLSFLPFVWGDYWVIDLDEDYQLVAVSEPRREYLWILARTPQVARGDYERLLARLEQKGFDLGRLERTRQD